MNAQTTPPEAGLKYRPDIDGLRALAIIPVVWFHSGLGGLPGGFTGVDTFFVISGYLITLIVHREVQQGTFTFRGFYERRIRRIAPALLAVVAASTIAGFVLLLPYELIAFSKSGLAALSMGANVFFWKTADYFQLADQIAPLLHTWSLGVEEQFYLFFPAALLIAERWRLTRPLVLAILVASFAMCLILTARSPAFAFYLLPTRAWELMCGASLAVGLLELPKQAKDACSLVGLALLFAAALLLSAALPFPGWRALVPTIGAVLIIASGPESIAGRALSMRPPIHIGRISYSLYLWHWPVFVFLRHLSASAHLSTAASLAGIAASLVLAEASYRFIERPARDRSTSYRAVLFACGAALAALVIAQAAAIGEHGFPGRLPARVNKIADTRNAFAPLAHSCTDVSVAAARSKCRIGPNGLPKLLLWGDSHAAAISEAVGVGTSIPGIVISTGGCAPTVSWTSPTLKGRDYRTCEDKNRSAVSFIIDDPQIATVVLSGFWSSHDRSGGAQFWSSLQETVDLLRSHGKRVLIVAGIPDPGLDVPWAAAIRSRFSRPALQLPCRAHRFPVTRAEIVDAGGGFCGKSPVGLFTDANHVSRRAGLLIIAPAIRAHFRQSSSGHRS